MLLPWRGQIDITGPLFLFFLFLLGAILRCVNGALESFQPCQMTGNVGWILLVFYTRVQNSIRGNVGCNSSRLLIDERDSISAFSISFSYGFLFLFKKCVCVCERVGGGGRRLEKRNDQ